MGVVICGGGIIGVCTAYYLSLKNIPVTIVERSAIACASSGKSGGFLAFDWCRGSPLDALARRSFALHAELSQEISEDWGYRRIETLGLLASENRNFSNQGNIIKPNWLATDTQIHGQLGTSDTTAQVDPSAFTRTIMKAASKLGAEIKYGVVEGLELSKAKDQVSGVIVDGTFLGADSVVIAMGPWSLMACQWLPLPAVYGLKGHSLVFDFQPKPIPHAVFVEYETDNGQMTSPEVFPRKDGTTYVCGSPGNDPLPSDPNSVLPEPAACRELINQIKRFAPGLGASFIKKQQACFRPVTQDGLPLIGPISGIAGAYIASGHSVWGILNAPATGEAMAELIVDGKSGLTLSAFDPSRLPVFSPDRFHGSQ